MTTKHREKLDEALIRPGRIDMQLRFSHAERDVISELFLFLFGALGKKECEGNAAIQAKADEFASIVPASTFSQAEIISYLLLRKNNPDSAIGQCQKWVDEKREEKRIVLGNKSTSKPETNAMRHVVDAPSEEKSYLV